MSETISIDFSEPIPLFPLPNHVLLPHAAIPLHIFEPRYRLMTRDALDTRKLIAIAIFEGSDWKDDYYGSPPLRSHVCVGYIVQHDELPDGRFNILLQGVCRARIEEEIPFDDYRRAILQPTETTPVMNIDLDAERTRIEKLLHDPLLEELAAVTAIKNWLSQDVSTVALVDLATMTLCEKPEPRYEMLAEPDALRRAHRLETILRDTRRTLALAHRFAPRDLPDHMNLN